MLSCFVGKQVCIPVRKISVRDTLAPLQALLKTNIWFLHQARCFGEVQARFLTHLSHDCPAGRDYTRGLGSEKHQGRPCGAHALSLPVYFCGLISTCIRLTRLGFTRGLELSEILSL